MCGFLGHCLFSWRWTENVGRFGSLVQHLSCVLEIEVFRHIVLAHDKAEDSNGNKGDCIKNGKLLQLVNAIPSMNEKMARECRRHIPGP